MMPFLAMDRNGNGPDEQTVPSCSAMADRLRYTDRIDVTTLNGFEALAFLKEGSWSGRSTLDRQIDSADAALGICFSGATRTTTACLSRTS